MDEIREQIMAENEAIADCGMRNAQRNAECTLEGLGHVSEAGHLLELAVGKPNRALMSTSAAGLSSQPGRMPSGGANLRSPR